VDRAVAPGVVYHHAEVLGLGFRARFKTVGGWAGAGFLLQRSDQAFGFIGGDFAGGEHFQNLLTMFVHISS
jgi:hypothetical protein